MSMADGVDKEDRPGAADYPPLDRILVMEIARVTEGAAVAVVMLLLISVLIVPYLLNSRRAEVE